MDRKCSSCIISHRMRPRSFYDTVGDVESQKRGEAGKAAIPVHNYRELCSMPEEPCTECDTYKSEINNIIAESEIRNIEDNKTEGR